MKKAPKAKASTPFTLWHRAKKILLGISIVALLSILADVLGVISFFGGGESISTDINSNNQNSFNSQISTVNRPTYNIEYNSYFYTYNCENKNLLKEKKTSAENRKGTNYDNAVENIILASGLMCNGYYEDALDHLAKYSPPPTEINSVTFYDMRGYCYLRRRDYYNAYLDFLKAYNISNDPKADYAIALGLLSHFKIFLRQKNFSLRDLDNVIFEKSLYKLKIEDQEIDCYSNVIKVSKAPGEEEQQDINLLRRLGFIKG